MAKQMLALRNLFSKASGMAVGALAAGLAAAAPVSALAATITYDANLNFDPDNILAGPGVGTVTGNFTFDTGTNTITSANLVESTNNGQANIGGGFGSPTYTTFTFDEVNPFTIIFFGSPVTFPTATATIAPSGAFGGQPALSVFFETDTSIFDGSVIGPKLTFDFAYPTGGAVQPGIFDSITSENKYLFGTVTPEAISGVPEPASWTLMIGGAALSGGVLRLKRRRVRTTLARA